MNYPKTLDDLSLWFWVRHFFLHYSIVCFRRIPRLHSWALGRMAELLRPLPVRLQDEILG